MGFLLNSLLPLKAKHQVNVLLFVFLEADDHWSPVGKEFIFCCDGEHPSKEEEDPVKQYCL